MDMRSTRSFRSKRKAITAAGGEEGEREGKTLIQQNMHIPAALSAAQHTCGCCSGLGKGNAGSWGHPEVGEGRIYWAPMALSVPASPGLPQHMWQVLPTPPASAACL